MVFEEITNEPWTVDFDGKGGKPLTACVGSFVADENGRGGTLVGIHQTSSKLILVVKVKEGFLIELDSELVTFVASPDVD